jgi:hypothetical protein
MRRCPARLPQTQDYEDSDATFDDEDGQDYDENDSTDFYSEEDEFDSEDETDLSCYGESWSYSSSPLFQKVILN